MSDVNSLSGGMDTLRLSVVEREEQARRRTRSDARGILAALMVDRAGGLDACRADDETLRTAAAEFADLCQALGLDPPTPRPTEPLAPSGHQARTPCRREGCGKGIRARREFWHRLDYCSHDCLRLVYLAGEVAR